MNEPIQTIVSIFYHVDAIKTSINTILRQEKLSKDIYVIENPSQHTEKEIKPFVLDLIERGHIKKYFLTDRNITHHATKIVLLDNHIDFLNTKYIMITNGNISTTDDTWLDKEISILEKFNNVFMTAVPISLDNMPPDKDGYILPMHGTTEHYDYGFTGKHMMLFRSEEFKTMMDVILESGHYTDADIHGYMKTRAKTCAVIFEPRFHRHTWDLYKNEDDPYIKVKENYTLDEFWRHDEYCSYTVYEFGKEPIRIEKEDRKNFVLEEL